MMPFSWLVSEVNDVASRSDAASLSPEPLYNGLIANFLTAMPFGNECRLSSTICAVNRSGEEMYSSCWGMP
jgi:hypothetical protein